MVVDDPRVWGALRARPAPHLTFCGVRGGVVEDVALPPSLLTSYVPCIHHFLEFIYEHVTKSCPLYP